MACGFGGCALGGCIFSAETGEPEKSATVESGPGGGSEPSRDVAGLKLGNRAKTFYFDSSGFALRRGDPCVVEWDDGEIFGFVVQPTGTSRRFAAVKEMKKVLRRATPRDREIHERNQELRTEVLSYCTSRVKELRLEMKVVEIEPAFTGRRVTCYFTAEQRIDFRELVRDMAHRFRCRIEMRQIGARDEAKLRGGYGICGRALCCTTFLPEFAPISVKMAKRQGLSLNPSKISGLCGRLMCCLRFEDAEEPKPAAEEGSGGAGASPGGGARVRKRYSPSRSRTAKSR